jgi:hypothetical protein
MSVVEKEPALMVMGGPAAPAVLSPVKPFDAS